MFSFASKNYCLREFALSVGRNKNLIKVRRRGNILGEVGQGALGILGLKRGFDGGPRVPEAPGVLEATLGFPRSHFWNPKGSPSPEARGSAISPMGETRTIFSSLTGFP